MSARQIDSNARTSLPVNCCIAPDTQSQKEFFRARKREPRNTRITRKNTNPNPRREFVRPASLAIQVTDVRILCLDSLRVLVLFLSWFPHSVVSFNSQNESGFLTA